MVSLRSTLYPSLVISDLGVRFVDGLLETDDPRVVARARRLGRLGVVVEGGDIQEVVDVQVERRDQPSGNASRQAWADYAEESGVAVGSEWTRNEIRDAVLGVIEGD